MISSIVIHMLNGWESNKHSHKNRTQLVITPHYHSHLFAFLFF